MPTRPERARRPIAQRLLPSPWLSLGLLALWLVLNQSLSIGHFILGALLAVAGPAWTASLRPSPVRLHRRLPAALRLVTTVAGDIFVSNLQVAASVWRAGRRPPDSRFVRVPLDLRDAHGLAALAIITTVVPGTVWCELAMDRSALLLHVLEVGEDPSFVERFKRRYERPLMEIFG